MTWARGSTRQWRTLRAATLRRDPTCRCEGCRQCTPHGCDRPSSHADHIINVAVRPDLEYEPANVRGMCQPCHDVKTKREAADGRTRTQRTKHRKPEPHPGVIPPDA